jgi:pimeloyl-ACP methyl ester carboxylesterase
MNKTTSRDGTTIAYDRVGDGPAVVIVEGAFCTRMTSAPLAALLADRFTVYAYDRRGRGDSGDTAPYTVEREVEDLAAIIGEAGGSAMVYGMSSGAVLGLEAAARGLPVTRLALYEPPVPLDGGTITAGLLARLHELLAVGRRGDAAAAFLTVTGVPDAYLAQMRNSPMWAGLESIAHTLPYDVAITGDPTVVSDRAAAVSVPTLVIAGGSSGPYLLDSARSVVEAVPGAEHRVLAGQTHAVDKSVLAPVLLEFFG